MAQSLTINVSAVDGIDTVELSRERVGDALLKIDVDIPDGAVNQVIVAAIDVSKTIAEVFGCDQAITLKTNGTDEVQQVATSGTVSGGTFPLTYDGQTATGIAWNATATDVETALIALSNIAPGDVDCAGGPLPGTPVTVTFQGNLAATNVPQMTTSSASLTGGGTIAVTTTTPGVAASNTFTIVPGFPLVWDDEAGYYADPLTTDVVRFLASNSSGASGTFTGRVLSDS